MKKVFASFKKYPKSYTALGIALIFGAAWVSGEPLVAIVGLVGFVILVKAISKGAFQDE